MVQSVMLMMMSLVASGVGDGNRDENENYHQDTSLIIYPSNDNVYMESLLWLLPFIWLFQAHFSWIFTFVAFMRIFGVGFL